MTEDTVLKAETGKRVAKASVPALLLIAGGVILLATNLLHIHLMNYLWPGFFVGTGLLLMWPAYQSTPSQRNSLSFLAVPGAMTIALGVMLFLMNLVNHYESMAYAWTLLLAAGGAGYLYLHRFDASSEARDKAHQFIRKTVLAFMGLATIFELIIFQSLGDWWPLFLVGLGFYLLIKNKRSATNE